MISKNCPHCGNSFIGRSNRAYCSQSCKSAINNFRIGKRDENANAVAQKVKFNRRILMTLYAMYGSIELPSIVVDKTKLDARWHSFISTDGKKQIFLDCVLDQLPNNNYRISKLESK
jgi:hypothetical protein